MVGKRVAVIAALVMVPLLGAAGCNGRTSGSPNSGGGASSGGDSGGSSGGSSSGGGSKKATASNSPASSSAGGGTSDSVGTVNLTFRGTSGSDSVSCSSISSEFTVSPNGGRIRWTALISDHDPDGPVPGRRPEGVSVEPSSGMLDPGNSQLVRVRGTFDGSDRHFWVKVLAPNRATSGAGVTLRFNCR
jgi:hypothetical protein